MHVVEKAFIVVVDVDLVGSLRRQNRTSHGERGGQGTCLSIASTAMWFSSSICDNTACKCVSDELDLATKTPPTPTLAAATTTTEDRTLKLRPQHDRGVRARVRGLSDCTAPPTSRVPHHSSPTLPRSPTPRKPLKTSRADIEHNQPTW